jgi:hypothetical protein
MSLRDTSETSAIGTHRVQLEMSGFPTNCAILATDLQLGTIATTIVHSEDMRNAHHCAITLFFLRCQRCPFSGLRRISCGGRRLLVGPVSRRTRSAQRAAANAKEENDAPE